MIAVKDIMTPDVLTVGPEDSVEHAASVIINAGVRGLPVVDEDGRLQGVISDFALLAMTYDPEIRARPVSSVMTAELITVTEDESAQDTARLLVEHRIGRVFVVREGRVVGIVSRRDLVRARQQAAQIEEPAGTIDPDPSLRAQRPRVLVVDDSVIIHAVFADTLPAQQYDLSFAFSGEDVFAAIAAKQPELILLDRVMPGLDGVEVLRRLKRDATTRKIPVIMVTSCDRPVHVAESLDLGAVDYIQKPFSAMEVQARVRSALRTYRLQEQLRSAKQQAEAATQAKDQFLANMSHEIRTPMNAILGFSHSMLRDELTEDQRRRLQFIDEAGQALLRLIDDILDISRIESGMLRLEPENVDLRPILQGAAEMAESLANEKRLLIQLHVDEEMPARLVADAGRLRQILYNLLGNAVKFTDNGRVDLRVVVESKNENSTKLRFEVTDTGIGIPQAQQKRIFDNFTQADGSITRRYGGTGLGLAICQKLVQMMDGELGVESRQGEGARFWFVVDLPHADPSAASSVPTDHVTTHDVSQSTDASDAPARRTGAKREPIVFDGQPRVLYAEDARLNQILVREFLKHTNLRLDIVDDGQQALDRVVENSYDLILMDGQMPNVDGYEATRRIRAIEETAGGHIPIIALTALAMKNDREKCLEAGMDDYLAKPFKEHQLIEVIRRNLPQTARV